MLLVQTKEFRIPADRVPYVVLDYKNRDREEVYDCGNIESWQLIKGKVRLLGRIIGKAVSGNCELVPGDTHSQQSNKIV